MNLRSGKTVHYANMPSDIIDKKQVLLDSRLKGKRIIGLRTYYKELEKERK